MVSTEVLNLIFAGVGGVLVHLWHRQNPAVAAAPKTAPVLPSTTKLAPVVPSAPSPLDQLPSEVSGVLSLIQELRSEVAKSQAHGLLQDLALLARAKQSAKPGEILQLPANYHLPQ